MNLSNKHLSKSDSVHDRVLIKKQLNARTHAYSPETKLRDKSIENHAGKKHTGALTGAGGGCVVPLHQLGVVTPVQDTPDRPHPARRQLVADVTLERARRVKAVRAGADVAPGVRRHDGLTTQTI